MAEPSRANWDEGQPRTCHACGKKLRITRDKLWLDTANRVSWHVDCYHERVRAHRDWLRLHRQTGLADDQAEWDRKRELEAVQRRTGRDPVAIEWPP